MALVYFQHKIAHNGLCTYKVFEGITRGISQNSLNNLNNYKNENIEKDSTARTEVVAGISKATSKRIFKYCQKLAYYSCTRKFKNSKGKEFSFKINFLTLTAPHNYTTQQINTAFEHFLDYVSRTGNCSFVYKKEVGYKSGHFHIHLLLNNFIPYYIVSWKWKRLLMAQNPDWPQRENGKDYNAHTRIEIPKNKRQTTAYIAKYLTKDGHIVEKVGKLWGFSRVLKDCQEVTLIENDIDATEYQKLTTAFKTIQDEFMTFVCFDPHHIKKLCPKLYAVFETMYMEFTNRISLPQKFYYC